jgi:hypothetical protein
MKTAGVSKLYILLVDAVGRRTERIDYNAQFMQALTNLFDYNARSELTSALMSTNNYQYAYDSGMSRLHYTA